MRQGEEVGIVATERERVPSWLLYGILVTSVILVALATYRVITPPAGARTASLWNSLLVDLSLLSVALMLLSRGIAQRIFIGLTAVLSLASVIVLGLK